MADATPKQKATALNNRSVAKREMGDVAGAMDDYAAVLGMVDAPAPQKAWALNRRGWAQAEMGNVAGAKD